MLLKCLLTLTLLSPLLLVEGNGGYDNAWISRPNGAPDRQLLAARLVSKEAVSGNSIKLHNDMMLHYIEETENESPLAAHMALSADLGTLLLEDMGSDISTVECDQSSIRLELSPHAYTALKKAIKPYKEFYVVTSHESCNSHGGRMPYYVSDVFFSDQYSSATLKTLPVQWKDVYHINLEFGPDNQEYEPLAHAFSRRQAAAATTTTTSAGAPTTETDVSLATSFIDYALFNASTDDFGIGLTCLNCSSFGQLDIVSGTASSVPNQTTTGNIAVTLNGFGLYILLELDMLANVDDSWHDFPWFKLSPPGLSIPGVGRIGPSYTLELHFTSLVEVDTSLTFGFEMLVPDNTGLSITLSPANASISGFGGTTFNMLPFDAMVSNPTADFNLSLHHELLFGIDLFDGGFEAEVGAFIDAPKMELKVESRNQVDIDCNPTNDSSVYEPINSRFGNLTNLEPFIDFDGGVLAEGTVLWIFGNEADYTVFDKDIALPTVCLAHATTSAAIVVTTTGTSGSGVATITSAVPTDWQIATSALASATASQKNGAEALSKNICLLGVAGSLLVSILSVIL